MVGVEPTRSCLHQILSLARLPIPSHRHGYVIILLKQKNIFISNTFMYKWGINQISVSFHNTFMKKILLICIVLNLSLFSFAQTYEGAISERSELRSNRIIDKATGQGVSGAKISLPKENYTTKTNKDGYFELDTAINGTSILSVQKDKYKPFSMTVTSKSLEKPLEVTIEKSNTHDISIDTSMYHLGDGSFSDNSANAGEFQSGAIGPFYTKKFNLHRINISSPVYLVIGSIIGIDTLTARTMGQNQRPNSYASAPEVYFNGNKVAEIQINGDGQKIKLPPNLVRKNGVNEVTIKTGRNLLQHSYVDYDDIEFMNLSIEN